MLRFAALLVAAALLAGCGADSPDSATGIDPAEVLRILPTPAGLDQSTEVATIDASQLQKAFAGVARAEAVQAYEDIGFSGGAMRTWSGPRGARLLTLVSRWRDHQTATNVGGGAVQLAAERSGAAAWTPQELSGARGARSPAVKVLSFAVADLSLWVRGDGPVDEAALIRTMDLMTRPARQAAR